MSSAAPRAVESKPVSPSPVAPQWPVVVPYLVAIGAQFPMLLLYYRNYISAQPHYQPFFIAVLAVIGLALMRWPFGNAKPFHQSLTSDVLIILGIGSAVLGVAFVEPWFAALASMLFVSSLFARTLDKESLGTLWPCSLPLYVYLALPMGMDVRLITTLQGYSAIYTSRMLDLAGLGHHMDGTVINVPSLQEYGIEQACSGVQSFFTLLLVAVVFVVLSRRIRVPQIGVSILALMLGGTLMIVRMLPGVAGLADALLMFAAVGCTLFALMGFRPMALILSAVFWAVFMNTIRILTIPISEYFMGWDLSSGVSHDVLGYFALTLGVIMLLSTDQFLLFLFGPVEESSDSGSFGRLFGRIWNTLTPKEEDEEGNRRKKKTGRVALGPNAQKFLWGFMACVVVMGLWQFVDVQRAIGKVDDNVRFFDRNVTVDLTAADISEKLGAWERGDHVTQDRSRGSDLGERSDVWQLKLPREAHAAVVQDVRTGPVLALGSIDQPFPGWHELTTCYKNTGWKLIKRSPMSPETALKGSPALASLGEEALEWDMVEATFEKPTGERGYLLFSHFDRFGEGLDVPGDWGTIRAFVIRASNRLSHRIRASLLNGEAYQVQVFLTSYDELDPALKQEVRRMFIEFRTQAKTQFLKKLVQEE